MSDANKASIDKNKTFGARALLYRYAIALGLILCFVSMSHIVSVSVIRDIDRSSDLISKSINQRSTVSRIVSFAEMVRLLRTQASVDHLSREIDALERTHGSLAEAARDSDSVAELYFEGGRGPALDPIMRKFIADARIVASSTSTEAEIDAALVRLRRAGGQTLPAALQEANEGHQLQARAYSDDLSAVQSAAYWLAIVVLVFEAIFIFIPAHRTVRRSMEALAAQAARLEQARDAVEARNRELVSLRNAAEHDALHDELTGLANRRGFEREIERLAKARHAPGNGVAILHIDLDRFKEINDTLGHAAGDAVLRHVGETLRGLTRSDDFVARIGGDEFVVARVCDGDRRSLSEFAERVVARLSEPVEMEGSLCQFGASVGIEVGVSYAPGGDLDPSRLIANADIALYHAKERGRGRVEFFSEALRAAVEQSKALSDDMALGLGRGEFVAVYQPQIDVTDGGLHGVEALARWRHPERGELAPGVFLPIAERLRKTADVDHVIQQQALRDLEAWDALGLRVPRLSINVSSQRLRDAAFTDVLMRAPHARGRVSVEVLETIFTDTIDDALQMTIDNLFDGGISVEIDDFGTGHASLLSLLSLKPARLKIARELVAPLPDSADHVNLARSICDIARSLGVGVIAEGVETAAQRDALVELGCTVMQGYFFARPMTREALAANLAAQEPPWRQAS